jgi:dihydrodipicolinate reductase
MHPVELHEQRPYTAVMRTVALLGATGSIGRQALEIIRENPELELVAAA